MKNVTLSERIFVYTDWTPFINTQQGLWQRTDAHKLSIFCPPPLKIVYFLSSSAPLQRSHTKDPVKTVLIDHCQMRQFNNTDSTNPGLASPEVKKTKKKLKLIMSDRVPSDPHPDLPLGLDPGY